ncbi:DUF1127 domain-containing protein [Aureimonas phyllosphaerae]|uniref:Uncharacterized protein YjiS (DUF1127 family) n=1 Tax=Aureimonas phyllosphaerae TaxID=1166078 RepID=A0A7W6FV50_9HYPH|nr:DUF1127 domain-containing protein [Aureimonas phyllosphaerae]MBB3936798.1 uncharacterized protein YjiS (DUF1127 family) [Aureimonas phyllosphaerae]MBB3961087.1 uncharacterized protein YjiS (DUF1127 family) [Aureimonas phyllosphaerae]SFF25999.1 protein of unknown function [Aureimonas phyllosphaerae]
MTLATKTPRSSVMDMLAPTKGALAFPAFRAIVRTLLNRRAAYRVSELPDYLLKDIGLKRDDVHEALHADWREDPTFKLALAAARRRGRVSPRRD